PTVVAAGQPEVRGATRSGSRSAGLRASSWRRQARRGCRSASLVALQPPLQGCRVSANRGLERLLGRLGEVEFGSLVGLADREAVFRLEHQTYRPKDTLAQLRRQDAACHGSASLLSPSERTESSSTTTTGRPSAPHIQDSSGTGLPVRSCPNQRRPSWAGLVR